MCLFQHGFAFSTHRHTVQGDKVLILWVNHLLNCQHFLCPQISIIKIQIPKKHAINFTLVDIDTMQNCLH